MSQPPRPARHPLLPPRVLLNLLLAGILLRLLVLGYWSLWLDEGVTWSWATLPTWRETITAEANHPPLWWVVTRLQIGFFGDSEAALRAPSAFLGVLGMPLAWLLGLRLLDPALTPRRGGFSRTPDGGRGRRTALWFAGLVAVSAYLLEYAQEARMYTALLVEALALALLYLRWLDRDDRLSLAGYAVVGALALHTHYFAVFILGGHAAHALWLTWQSRRDAARLRPWPLLAAGGVAGLLFLPWAAYAVTHFDRIAHVEVEPFGRLASSVWRMGVGPGIVAHGPGESSGLPGDSLPTILVTALLWAAPLVLGVMAVARRGGLRSLVACCALLPVASLLVASLWVCLIHERYLVFLAPWVLLLAVLGATHAPRLLRPLLGLGLVVLTAAGVVVYVVPSEVRETGRAGSLDGEPLPVAFAPDRIETLRPLQGAHPYGRTPWRRASTFVQSHAEPGDVVVLHPGYVHLVWDYYEATHDTELETIELPLEAVDAETVRAAYGARLAGRRRVFLVLGPPETEEPDHYVRVLTRVLGRIWLEEGATGLSSTPPIPFRLGWGLRVATFSASR